MNALATRAETYNCSAKKSSQCAQEKREPQDNKMLDTQDISTSSFTIAAGCPPATTPSIDAFAGVSPTTARGAGAMNASNSLSSSCAVFGFLGPLPATVAAPPGGPRRPPLLPRAAVCGTRPPRLMVLHKGKEINNQLTEVKARINRIICLRK